MARTKDRHVAEPPSGAVSFLLTDIEGSVELWQRDQEAMSAALATATTTCSGA
jgi:hypothetical protein